VLPRPRNIIKERLRSMQKFFDWLDKGPIDVQVYFAILTVLVIFAILGVISILCDSLEDSHRD
jgi:hypothetical protein